VSRSEAQLDEHRGVLGRNCLGLGRLLTVDIMWSLDFKISTGHRSQLRVLPLVSWFQFPDRSGNQNHIQSLQ